MYENLFAASPPVDVAVLAETRATLHSLAEHVLAPDLHRSVGKIGLRRTVGGVGQPEHLVDGKRRRVRIDGTRLAVTAGDVETWHPLTTLGAAADIVGVALGERTGAYEPTSPDDPGLDVAPDAAGAAGLAGWFAFVDEALERLRTRQAHRIPSVVQLWPEHFDLACSFAEINFGGSPGDAGDGGRSEPYLYVGPWTQRTGDFWNEPYGAARSWADVGTIEDAVAFFELGLAKAERA